MRKFIIKSSGKEVSLGDNISVETVKEKSCGMEYFHYTGILCECNVQYFIDRDIIEEVKVPTEEFRLVTNIEYYIDIIAEKMELSTGAAKGLIEKLIDYNPSIAFSMLLKEIALTIDNGKYNDHISNSPELFVVSYIDGAIIKADPLVITNYKNFAAFRSYEDAKSACKILNPILKRMFSKSGK